MARWITHPHREGRGSRQAHADLPADACYEREAGREGFSGPTAHFHHRRPPTSWTRWEGPLRPRAYDLSKAAACASPLTAGVLLANQHCRYGLWRCEASMDHLARNADGDWLLFFHEGEATLFCDYGRLEVVCGDYVVIPRGTQWRLELAKPVTLLMIEATGSAFRLPDRGLLGPQAVFDPAMLDVPAIDDGFIAQQDDRPWEVRIKRGQRLSSVFYDYSPLDAVGWHGDLSVVRLNWRHLRPVVSHRYHLPPSVHTTFVAERFAVCTFVPRPVESDPGALKLPFYHSNDDIDEVLFYHRGQFLSRDDIRPGMVTFHPAGFVHGPHPKAFERSMTAAPAFTEEVAVMLDARDPLEATADAGRLECRDYEHSWKREV